MSFEFPVKVYYEDTDCLGVVYHTNYLKYFERARTEMLSTHIAPLAELNARGEVYVVVEMKVSFRAPAKFCDELIIESTVEIASAYRAVFKQQARRVGEDRPLVLADVEIVCLDERGELRELPEDLRAIGEVAPKKSPRLVPRMPRTRE